MRGLYAIIDADFLQASAIPLVDFAKRVLEGGPCLVQLRAKHSSARATLEWLRALRPLCTARGALLFANDRPDLAVLGGCDGVHVGQSDLSARDVRRFSPSLRIGVSTHGEAELLSALADRPDYVAYGPVFQTTSKKQPEPAVGLEGLARAAELSRPVHVPLVAIGGIDVGRARGVRAHAELAAVISALLPDEGLAGVTRRTRELSALLTSGSSGES
jgi:thiamine-phosphate pyrophosphorylase